MSGGGGGFSSGSGGGGGSAGSAGGGGRGTSNSDASTDSPLPRDAGTSSGAPTGLLVELTAHPETAAITNANPSFAWIVPSDGPKTVQTAYRILVASTQQNIEANVGDAWDSNKVASSESINVAYAGQKLAVNATYYWKVQTWDQTGAASSWSAAQAFKMAASIGTYSTAAPPVVQRPVVPATIAQVGTGHYFIDFGRDAFGWVELTIDAPAAATLSVSLGEKANGQAVNTSPGASIRAAQVSLQIQQGLHTYRVNTPKNGQNTSGSAILLPAALGVVMPFRYVEVNNSPVALTNSSVKQIALEYPFDDTASAFSSSSQNLDQVWQFCKYSMKATTFADMYVDGDRERTPYEADSYIHQLGHYNNDRDFALARKSHEYLMVNPTWPTEWKFHSIMMAWADWMYTGNLASLAHEYTALKGKTFESYADADGLLNTAQLTAIQQPPNRNIVDWPQFETDGFVFTDVNTVVNAFYCHVLGLMADIAGALGNTADQAHYSMMATKATAALNSKLVNATTGLYIDGETTNHSSLHANMFPLAFGLVPPERQAKVASFVQSRGMGCSVYGAQYLLEALFRAGNPQAAVALLTATTQTSWMNMLAQGATMTIEAWDQSFIGDMDWNHAWGGVPANIVPRFILGVTPLRPGFATAAIAPQLGSLTHVQGTVPTIRGPVQVTVDSQPLVVTVAIPPNMTANVAIPSSATACTPLLDGQSADVVMSGGQTWIEGLGSGQHTIRCK